jgi:hypothetical protein
MNGKQNFLRFKLRGSLLVLVVIFGLQAISAEAALSVTVKNETGYDLSEVKYVQEIGNAKVLAGKVRQLANGNSYTFSLIKSGAYRVYAFFIMGGKKTYAKGNANNLRDGGRYTLTLKKVIVSQSGSSLNFIDQSEFDAIK